MNSTASLRQPLLALVRQAQHSLQASASPLCITDSTASHPPPRDLLTGIRSVLTVLGMPAPPWDEMAAADIARLLVILELQLEEGAETLADGYGLLAEQHPRYCDLPLRNATQRLRFLCAERLSEALSPRADVAQESASESDVRALSAMLAAVGRLRLLMKALPAVFADGDSGVLAGQSQALVVMVRRQLVAVRFAGSDECCQQDSADQLVRRLCLLVRDGMLAAPTGVGAAAPSMEDRSLYNVQRQRLLRARFVPTEVAAQLSTCFRDELRVGLTRLREEWRALSGVQGLHYLCDWHCACSSRLATAALVSGDIARHDLLALLRSIMLWLFERSEPLRQDELRLFEEVCDAALSAGDDAGVEGLEARLADALCARELSTGDSAENSAVATGQVAVYLAQNIHSLLTARQEMQACCGRPQFVALNRQLLVELRMLAAGARVLRVYRVEALSTVLAEVHQLLDRQEGRAVEESCMSLLMAAHARLGSSLNCAAAYREVADSRELIARIYRWLDARAGAADSNAQTQNKDAAELAACFQRETVELMERIEQGASSQGQYGTANNTAMPTPCPDLLSLLHTLKGNALQFDCPHIGALCHGFEQLLLGQRATSNSTAADGSFPAAVQACARQLRAAVDDLGHRCDTVPLPPATDHNLPVSVQAMARIAALAEQARSCNRAMLEVLAGIDSNQDSVSRLLLLRDLLNEQQRHGIQLQEEIAGSRSIRLERLIPRLQRLAARHANLLDRQVRLHVQGEQLQIDRLLLERLVAPIEHLLRNAIDHGIESVEERRAASKPDCGNITLTITRQAQALWIALADDGRGIDINDFMPAGTAEGKEQQERWLQRLFDSGITTRTQATTQSGHGLGLAAVRDAIMALGGRIRVSSSPGTTCFHITLPV